MKRVIIIQGPSSNVLELKKAWLGYDIIWSTWFGEENNYDENDIVVYSDKPSESGVGNLNLQLITTHSGLIKAKELGYDRAFKWRSDMIPTNPDILISCLSDGFNLLFNHIVMPVKPNYFVDYVMEGEVNIMLNVWSFTNLYSTHAEAIITESINKHTSEIYLFGGNLNDKNDIYWLKKNISIKDYKKYPEYKHNE